MLVLQKSKPALQAASFPPCQNRAGWGSQLYFDFNKTKFKIEEKGGLGQSRVLLEAYIQ